MHPQVEWSKPPSDRTSHTQSKILWLRIKISLDMKLGSMHARIADFCILRASMPGIAWLAEGDKLDKVNQKCHASVLQNSIQTQVDTSEAGCTERGGATLGTLWWIWHWATCVLWECLLLKGVLKNNLKRLGWLKRAFCKTFSSSYWNNTLKYIKAIENHSKCGDTATAICTVLKFCNSTLCLEAAVPGSPDLLTQPSLFQGPCKEFHHVPMQTLSEFFRSLHWL